VIRTEGGREQNSQSRFLSKARKKEPGGEELRKRWSGLRKKKKIQFTAKMISAFCRGPEKGSRGRKG